MTYAQDRFYHSQILHRGHDGEVREMEQYTYESHSTLYDVLVFEGSKFVRVNCGSLSCMIDKWTPAHYEIERHFNLEHVGPNPSHVS